MNGTDELRKEANKADWVHCTTLRAIADRIVDPTTNDVDAEVAR